VSYLRSAKGAHSPPASGNVRGLMKRKHQRWKRDSLPARMDKGAGTEPRFQRLGHL